LSLSDSLAQQSLAWGFCATIWTKPSV